MPDAEGLLSFTEFREAVGYPEWRVRAALMALDIKPVTSAANLRKTFYRPEWIAQVQEWVEGKGQGQ